MIRCGNCPYIDDCEDDDDCPYDDEDEEENY